METDERKEEIKLKANIFYDLLLEAMKDKKIQFEKCVEEKLTQTHMYYDLCVLTDTEYESLGDFEDLSSGDKLKQQYKNVSSKFRSGTFSCKKSGYFPFNRSNIIYNFDSQMRNEYQSTYKKAIEFAHRYFDNNASGRNIELIKKLLYYIMNDVEINDAEGLFICSDGSSITKSDLKNIKEIEFEAFLLGVWHYLIVSGSLRTDLKPLSKEAYNSLKKQYENKLIKLKFFDETIGNNETVASGENKPTIANTNLQTIKDPEKVKKLKKGVKRCTETNPDYFEDFDSYPIEADRNIDIISVLKNNDIRLSRGIFFYLLVHSIQTVHPKRNKNAVERLFLDLLNLTADNSCSIDFSQSHVRDHHDKFGYLKALSFADCLDDETLINAFSDRLSANYDEVLSDMIKIRKKYFNSGSENEVLTVALIEFIRNDDSIDNSQEFLVCSDGTVLIKEQLYEVGEIEFEPFLLGVWHYVVTQLNSNDFADEHTFDTVFKVSYTYNGKDRTIYRSGNIIEEQSELYAPLIYLEE